MARITVEDCLRKVGSRFDLVLLAAGRAKMLLGGAKHVAESENKEVVTALREIAEGKVHFVEPETEESEAPEESPAQAEGESQKEGEKKEE